jgi:hypothetical protein
MGVPIPYDFDHSGLMKAGYAKSSEILEISSITHRLYRGLAYDKQIFDTVFDNFRQHKSKIYPYI